MCIPERPYADNQRGMNPGLELKTDYDPVCINNEMRNHQDCFQMHENKIMEWGEMHPPHFVDSAPNRALYPGFSFGLPQNLELLKYAEIKPSCSAVFPFLFFLQFKLWSSLWEESY